MNLTNKTKAILYTLGVLSAFGLLLFLAANQPFVLAVIFFGAMALAVTRMIYSVILGYIEDKEIQKQYEGRE